MDRNIIHIVAGMRMCPELEVFTLGCVQQMDTLTITVQPQLTAQEKIFVPADILATHHIQIYNKEYGLVLHGVGDAHAYTDVLKHVRYLYKGTADIARTITVSP